MWFSLSDLLISFMYVQWIPQKNVCIACYCTQAGWSCTFYIVLYVLSQQPEIGTVHWQTAWGGLEGLIKTSVIGIIIIALLRLLLVPPYERLPVLFFLLSSFPANKSEQRIAEHNKDNRKGGIGRKTHVNGPIYALEFKQIFLPSCYSS